MKTNRFLGFIMSVAALAFAATACDDKKEDLGAPQITLYPSEISVEKAGTTTTIELTATREWTTDLSAEDAKWISVLPTSGSASADPVKVEVKVLENTGFDRSGSVSFSIGFDSKTLVVNQAGTGKVEGGSDTPDVPGTKMTLAQMLTADRKANTVVESEEVLVGAITTKGYVATDGTSSIYIYQNSTPTVKVGDKITFKGTLEDYYGLPEITSPKTTTVSSGNTVTYPTAKDITTTFDSYTSSVAEYVTYVAKVVKNGNYTNFEVEGATKFKGALSSAPTAIYSTFAEGDKVQVTGYFNTLNTSANLLNVIATEVKVLEKGEGGGDNPGGEEGTIKWSGLSDWTVSQDKNTISLSFGAYTITATKNSGSTAPTVNSNMKDCRVYAKGTVTIATTGDAMTQIVFNLSSQGQKRLAPITSDNGNVATQQAGDKTVTWTGSSKSVTFTVGDKADFGSDGSSEAGQFDFSSIVIK